jgi:hypothetical protein
VALERARQMDRALARGLPRRLLVALVAARRRLHDGRIVTDPDAVEAAEHPAGRGFDELLTRRIVRHRTYGDRHAE